MTHLKTFQDGSYIVETVLKANTYLNNTEAPSHPDYGIVDYITAMAGETINVWVRPFSDGRVYYTAYRKCSRSFKNIVGYFTHTEGVYYTCTHMKDAGGILTKNCGGHRASFELQELLG